MIDSEVKVGLQSVSSTPVVLREKRLDFFFASRGYPQHRVCFIGMAMRTSGRHSFLPLVSRGYTLVTDTLPDTRPGRRASRCAVSVSISSLFASILLNRGWTVDAKASWASSVGTGSKCVASASVCTRCRPDVPVMLRMAWERKLWFRASKYVYSGEVGGIPRITMNSVEPHPVVSFGRQCTYAVFPFSKQGVIRARSVSPFLKRLPELNPRVTGFPG